MPPVGAARAGALGAAIGAVGLAHIETQTASGDATIDFTNVFSSSGRYDRYVVFVDNFVASSDAVDLDVRFSSDGGSTWDSGASDYAFSNFTVNEGGGTGGVGSTGTSEIESIITSTDDQPANNDTSGATLVVSDPTDSNRATILRNGGTRYASASANSFGANFSGGIRLTQSAIDSIQFLPGSGNITSGIFSVYGAS